MFCPRCASQNTDDIKFCRACGTDLETVSRALAGQLIPTAVGSDRDENQIAIEDRLLKRARGVRRTIQGAILLGAAFLIGVALGIFSGKDDWIIIWTVFFGWMAGWGIVSLALGLGSVMESRIMLRRDGAIDENVAITSRRLTNADGMMIATDAAITNELSPSPNVTEHTTEPLIKPHLTSKDG